MFNDTYFPVPPSMTISGISGSSFCTMESCPPHSNISLYTYFNNTFKSKSFLTNSYRLDSSKMKLVAFENLLGKAFMSCFCKISEKLAFS